jgi:hypothetical protein
MKNFNPKRPPHIENIAEIKKNNELFANSLTYKILWREKFVLVLENWGYDKPYIEEYTKHIEKFLNDYEERIKDHLNNL